MTDLPAGVPEWTDPERGRSGAIERTRRGAIQRRRPGELTPAEKAVRRRNRQWLLILGVPAVVLGVAALAAAVIADSSSPSVKPAAVPAGFKAVSDGTFAYSVPSQWSKSSLYSDDVGDLDTAGTSGWAAEHLGSRTTPPVPGEAQPKSLQAFGEPAPKAYTLSNATPLRVPGAATAFRYELSRSDGTTATVVDAWQSSTGAELWLIVDAPPTTTEQVVASLRAG